MKTHGTGALAGVILQDFEQKKLARNGYSLRAYAKYLGLSHSTLHSLMKEESPGSPALIEKIAKKIGLNANERKYCSYISRLKTVRSSAKKLEIMQKAVLLNTRFNVLSKEEYEQICMWYNYPVMELIKIKGASLDPDWIAKKLGITSDEATIALESFQKLKIIEIKDGQLIVKRDYVELPTGAFEPARALHQTMIGKAREAVVTQPKGTRSFSNTVVRFRKSDMEEVHEFISKFRREFCLKFEGGLDHDSVYNLNVNFFRLDTDE